MCEVAGDSVRNRSRAGERELPHQYPGVYKAAPSPHIDLSDLNGFNLTDLPSAKPAVKTAHVWPMSGMKSLQLQDCFERTGLHGVQTWRNTTQTFFPTQSPVSTTKTTKVFANRKLWLEKNVQSLLRPRNAVYRSGDRVGQ